MPFLMKRTLNQAVLTFASPSVDSSIRTTLLFRWVRSCQVNEDEQNLQVAHTIHKIRERAYS